MNISKINPDNHEAGDNNANVDHVISKLTNPNDVVLDPLLGTGTTAIAALKLNRRFVGIDVSAEMLATARNRISQLISSSQRLQGENVN
ncbi:MAG: DNA methyltransferase [Candidatus Nitrosopolaris sp.]